MVGEREWKAGDEGEWGTEGWRVGVRCRRTGECGELNGLTRKSKKLKKDVQGWVKNKGT